MGNEAASVVILYCDETPIKDDYDVDKVTQQIALIQPLQESTVLNGARENIFIGWVFGGVDVFGFCTFKSVSNMNEFFELAWLLMISKCHTQVND